MKKNLTKLKIFGMMLGMMLMTVTASAITKTAITDGTWNTPAIWSPAGIPAAGDDVIIGNGIDVTVSDARTINSIVFGSASGSLSVNTGITLTVTTSITLQNNAAGGARAATLAGLGTISCASVVVGGTSTNLSADGTTTLTSTSSNLTISGGLSVNAEDDVNDTNNATFSLNSGTVNLAGVITLDSDADDNDGIATFTMNAGALNATLNLTNAAPFTTTGIGTETIDFAGAAAATTTVNYLGTAQTVIPGTYRNLVLSNSGAKTTTGVTIGLKLSIQGTATVGNAITWSTAILEYKGTGAQTTSNNEFPVAANVQLEEIIIDNTAGVTLNNAKTLAANSDLTLVNGYLTTTTTNTLTLGTGATATTSNGAFVNGPLDKMMAAATLFTFPVGTVSGGLRTVGVTPSGAGAATYRAVFNSANPRSITNGTSITSPIQQISACEYWTLSYIAGTTSARITPSWPVAANSCGFNQYVTNTASLLVARHTGTTWTSEGLFAGSVTGTAAAGGTITSNTQVTTLGNFVLATSNMALNPLPVTFSDVKAFEKGTGVQLEWSNLTEKDMVNYVIERSSNGINFSAISTVAPRSNNNDKESYTGFDAAPFAGANFYRIKTVEIDGKITYSKLLKVDIGRTTKGIVLYPNPVVGTDLSISLTTAKGQYNLVVYNNAGQQVYAKQLNLAGGTVSQSVELPKSLKTGVYNLMISGDNYKETKTFILQ